MLSFVSSLEGGGKYSWCAKTVQKHTRYLGTASDESRAFKEKKGVSGMAVVLITY